MTWHQSLERKTTREKQSVTLPRHVWGACMHSTPLGENQNDLWCSQWLRRIARHRLLLVLVVVLVVRFGYVSLMKGHPRLSVILRWQFIPENLMPMKWQYWPDLKLIGNVGQFGWGFGCYSCSKVKSWLLSLSSWMIWLLSLIYIWSNPNCYLKES